SGWVDNKSYLGTDFAGTPHLWKATHIPNNYQEIPVDTNHTQDTRFTYTDLGSASADAAQISAAGGIPGHAVDSGIWPAWGLEYLNETPTGTPVSQYTTGFGQNALCMKSWFDVNG